MTNAHSEANSAAVHAEEATSPISRHLIEYRVRPVTRYIVTRFEAKAWEDGRNESAGTECGEFSFEGRAYDVATALAFKEREDLGWLPGDERMQFASKQPPVDNNHVADGCQPFTGEEIRLNREPAA